jgi:hypothetical protein
MAANNPLLYNAVIAGAAGGSQERWLRAGSVAADYATFRTSVLALATLVDAAIAPAVVTQAEVQLMQSIIQGVFAGRFIQDTAPYTDIVSSIVELYTEIAAGLDVNPADTTIPLTIAAGAITIPDDKSGVPILHILVAGEGGLADSLDNILGGNVGQVVVLTAASDTVNIDVTNAGDMWLSASPFVLDTLRDTITLIQADTGNGWYEMARSNNA